MRKIGTEDSLLQDLGVGPGLCQKVITGLGQGTSNMGRGDVLRQSNKSWFHSYLLLIMANAVLHVCNSLIFLLLQFPDCGQTCLASDGCSASDFSLPKVSIKLRHRLRKIYSSFWSSSLKDITRCYMLVSNAFWFEQLACLVWLCGTYLLVGLVCRQLDYYDVASFPLLKT